MRGEEVGGRSTITVRAGPVTKALYYCNLYLVAIS